MAVVVATASTAHAQSVLTGTGAVQGRVTDARGAPVEDVKITIRGPAAIMPQTATTDADGTYHVTGLPPGAYEVTFSTATATVVRAEVRVDALAVTAVDQTLDQALGPGAARDAATSAIDPTSTLRSRTQDRTYLERVPVPGRGFEGAAGAHAAAHDDGYGLAIAGATGLENRYVVDGIDITGLQLGVVGTPVLSELVEQTDTIAGGAGAAWGRATGGVVHVTTRAGTNQLRGSVFGTLAPGSLARSATPTASSASTIAVENQPGYQTDFGVELGGPVIRDRAFFYVGFAPQLARGYEDLMFAKTYDANGTETSVPLARNPRFGKTTSRYAPLTARFGFRLSF